MTIKIALYRVQQFLEDDKPFITDDLSAASHENGVGRLHSKPFITDDLSAASHENGVGRLHSKPFITDDLSAVNPSSIWSIDSC